MADERRLQVGQSWSGSRTSIPSISTEVLDQVRERGPLRTADLHDPGERSGSSMWDWPKGKVALEALFLEGQVTTAHRPNFTRMYDLSERVIPDGALPGQGAGAGGSSIRSCSCRRPARWVWPPRPTWPTIRGSGCRRPDQSSNGWPSRGEAGRGRGRGLGSERVSTSRGPAAAAGRGTGAAVAVRQPDLVPGPDRAALGLLTTGSRSTSQSRSGCTATTCSRSSSTAIWWHGSTSRSDRKTGTLLVKGAFAEPGVDRTRVGRELEGGAGADVASWLGLEDVVVGRDGDLAEPQVSLIRSTTVSDSSNTVPRTPPGRWLSKPTKNKPRLGPSPIT